jgi:hypothetical protein
VKVAALPGLAVLNPGGHDPDLIFGNGPGEPNPAQHAPVNHHAYAACTRGGYYRTVGLAARHRSVLLLLRGNLKAAQQAYSVLKAHGCFVAVTFKEAGLHQVVQQLNRPGAVKRFLTLAKAADLCLASTPELAALFGSTSRRVVEVPTPYPVEVPAWNFSRPKEDRDGLFIGTREFDVPTRNHLIALLAARTLAVPLTVIARAADQCLLQALDLRPEQCRILRPLPYPDYLRAMASHRLVLQFDQSTVPGQVAGDALLCGLPTVGGSGATERLLHPQLHGHGRDFRTLLGLTRRLLDEPAFYQAKCDEMQRHAKERLSFAVVHGRLSECFPAIDG